MVSGSVEQHGIESIPDRDRTATIFDFHAHRMGRFQLARDTLREARNIRAPVPPEFDENAYRVRPAPATRLFEQGDVIDLGDRHFEVLHEPGHSPGSIALWESASGVLLSGDSIYDGPLVMTPTNRIAKIT